MPRFALLSFLAPFLTLLGRLASAADEAGVGIDPDGAAVPADTEERADAAFHWPEPSGRER